ncbi:hypothetical protein AYI69_g9331, partial [Smittium culicis]
MLCGKKIRGLLVEVFGWSLVLFVPHVSFVLGSVDS